MRNTTKLKHILIKYTVSLDMPTPDAFVLTLYDKNTGDGTEFEGKSYSIVMGKAYSYMLKELRKEQLGN